MRWLFLQQQGMAMAQPNTVAGPYCVQASQVFSAGAVEGDLHEAGAAAGEVYSAGPVAGQLACE